MSQVARAGHASNVEFVKKLKEQYYNELKELQSMNSLKNKKNFNINEIIEILPHRYPFILIDKIQINEPGISLTAMKNTTINEPYFQGHFPGQ